jgi:hypothetical protein
MACIFQREVAAALAPNMAKRAQGGLEDWPDQRPRRDFADPRQAAGAQRVRDRSERADRRHLASHNKQDAVRDHDVIFARQLAFVAETDGKECDRISFVIIPEAVTFGLRQYRPGRRRYPVAYAKEKATIAAADIKESIRRPQWQPLQYDIEYLGRALKMLVSPGKEPNVARARETLVS